MTSVTASFMADNQGAHHHYTVLRCEAGARVDVHCHQLNDKCLTIVRLWRSGVLLLSCTPKLRSQRVIDSCYVLFMHLMMVTCFDSCNLHKALMTCCVTMLHRDQLHGS